MAYRIRFYMEMNAREAMHLIELRTAPQGHPAYRRVCQAMHTLIAEQAGHRVIADAMTFADHSEVELERLRPSAPPRKQANSSESDVSSVPRSFDQYRAYSSRNASDSNVRMRSKNSTPSR